MVVCVTIRYQAIQFDWARRLLRNIEGQEDNKDASLEAQIAQSLCFFSGPSYKASDVRLEFNEASTLDRPQPKLCISVQASGLLAENQIEAAADRLAKLFGERLSHLSLHVVLTVGSEGVVREVKPHAV